MLWWAVMKILFLGQRGLPARWNPSHEQEARVEQLASRLASLGHTVFATVTKPYNPSYIRHLHGVSLVYLPTLNPYKPGGVVSLLFGIWKIWRLHPDVVHMHGWQAAALVRLAALLCPNVTFIWTVSSWSTTKDVLARFIAWQARGVFDAIISPTRKLQYELLTRFGLRTLYIPDGYETPMLESIPASHWGLRRGHYCVAEVSSQENLSLLARAHKRSKTHKKLAVLTPTHTDLSKAWLRRYPFVVVIVADTPRVRSSLVRQAALLISVEPMTNPELTLLAMDSGCPVVSTNYPVNQELLGTTGVFARNGDDKALAEAIADIAFYPVRQKQQGAKVTKRAKAHFSWERILDEYITAYHYPLVKRVPIDSIQAGLVVRRVV